MCIIVGEKQKYIKFICRNERNRDIDGSGLWVSWLIGSDTLAQTW